MNAGCEIVSSLSFAKTGMIHSDLRDFRSISEVFASIK